VNGHAAGKYLWVKRPVDGIGVLRINGDDYPFAVVRFSGVVVGYRVGPYEILSRGCDRQWQCECDDFRFRRGPAGFECKHARAVRSALAAIG